MRILLPATALLLAACDAGAPENVVPLDAPASQAAASGSAADANVSGPAIRIVGSSTVYPFTTAVAESFKRRYPSAATPIVESTGTGGGLKLFCDGVGARFPDIANASRRIEPSELALCAANGVDAVVEIQIGVDGVVLAQKAGSSALGLDSRIVYLALAATSPDGAPNRARTWRDVSPAAPPRRIEVLGPPPTSGTRDAFAELILEAGCAAVPALDALKAKDEDAYTTRCTRIREDGAFIDAGENDNLLVQKLVANPDAVGIFGWSYLEENSDRVEGLPLGGVAPTYDAIASGRYPASRPLYLYLKAQHVTAKPALRAFVAEFLRDSASGPGGYLSRRGLIPAPAATRASTASAAAALTPLTAAALE